MLITLHWAGALHELSLLHVNCLNEILHYEQVLEEHIVYELLIHSVSHILRTLTRHELRQYFDQHGQSLVLKSASLKFIFLDANEVVRNKFEATSLNEVGNELECGLRFGGLRR